MEHPTPMPRITFVEAGGAVHTIEADVGRSLMETAVQRGVPGIVAECGGSCACATCHVYVAEDWWLRVGEAGAMEQGMLECVPEPQPRSRLSCQVTLTAEMDGLVVHVPASQY